jgi:hypothetical protein
LEQIGALTELVHDYDRRPETISKETYPETDLLRHIERFGTLTALGARELRRTPIVRNS